MTSAPRDLACALAASTACGAIAAAVFSASLALLPQPHRLAAGLAHPPADPVAAPVLARADAPRRPAPLD